MIRMPGDWFPRLASEDVVEMDKMTMENVTEWLLAGPPWVRYRARLDLLGQSEEDEEVLGARQEMIDHPQLQEILVELAAWPGTLLKNHKDAKHPLHKLTFAADLGLTVGDPQMEAVVHRVLEHQSPEGPLQVLVNIHPRYGGTGEDQYAWMLCDAPLVLYALVKMGLAGDPRLRYALDHLVGLIQENGWPCAVSPELGRFRGPGRKADPCPYANLVMLKLLAQLPDWRDSPVTRVGAETLLSLWEQRRERRPYLFAMGTDFTKLKAPLIWYDVLHVLDVLTRFPWLHQDKRLRQMVALVKGKADQDGRFTPESIWLAWKGWDFGQKREPSPWLTLLARRAINRLEA